MGVMLAIWGHEKSAFVKWWNCLSVWICWGENIRAQWTQANAILLHGAPVASLVSPGSYPARGYMGPDLYQRLSRVIEIFVLIRWESSQV